MLGVLNNQEILYTKATSLFCKLMALVMAGAVLMQAAGFFFWFPYSSFVYYGVAGLSIIYIVFGGIKVNIRFFVFLLILGLNAFILPINPVFMSKLRFLVFALIMTVCSPLIKNERAVIYRQYLFKYLLIGLALLSIGSFFCFFLNINLMPYNRGEMSIFQEEAFEDYETHGGLFSGLYRHSMLLGPLSVFVALGCFIQYLYKQKVKWIVLFAILSLTVVISASRAALLALVVPVLWILFFSKKIFFSPFKVVLTILIALVLSMPLMDRVSTGLLNKQNARVEASYGAFDSRTSKYEARLSEFGESPIFGVGFSSVDSQYDVYNHLTGQIEPGTSHLAVLSMTGIVGTIVYVLLLLYAYKKVRRRSDLRAFFLWALFISFFVHMWFEGYIFGVGGVLCFLFWLTISECFEYAGFRTNDM